MAISESDVITQINSDDPSSFPCIQSNVPMDGLHGESSERHVASDRISPCSCRGHSSADGCCGVSIFTDLNLFYFKSFNLGV